MKIKMSEMYPGELAELIDYGEISFVKEKMLSMGIRIGKLLQMLQIDNKISKKAIIKIDSSIIALSLDIADRIYVNPIKETYETIRNLSLKDPLTGCYTRKHFDCVFSREISKFQELQIPFYILISDIDYFKKINDTYGHDVGDLVLTKFAYLLKNGIRRSDIIFRWGGEEFLIFLRGAKKEDALEVAERLREKIENTIFDVYSKLLKLTASFGGFGIPPISSSEKLIKEADIRLYEAKKTGRNKAVIV